MRKDPRERGRRDTACSLGGAEQGAGCGVIDLRSLRTDALLLAYEAEPEDGPEAGKAWIEIERRLHAFDLARSYFESRERWHGRSGPVSGESYAAHMHLYERVRKTHAAFDAFMGENYGRH